MNEKDFIGDIKIEIKSLSLKQKERPSSTVEKFIWPRYIWAKQNCLGKCRYNSEEAAFYFEKEEDAIAFKIYWT